MSVTTVVRHVAITMPAKKGTRSAKSTKAASKVSSKLDVFDENAVTSPVQVKNAKTLAANVDKAPATILGERNATNTTEEIPVAQHDLPKTKKTAKGKKTKGAQTIAKTSHAMEILSDPPSLSTRRLPEEQIQAFLQNYDLEAQTRLSRLRASLEMSVQSAMTRMKLTIERMPRAVRELTLGEFVDDYGADIHAFMNRAPVQHFEDGQKEWQDALQQSPAKAKRTQAAKSDDDRGSKSARRANNTARTSVSTTSSKSAVLKKGSSRAATATNTRSANLASPVGSAKSNSSMPAPSLSTFNPDIPKQTPRPRMARPGEMIQWQSINGSPICGIIGADGIIRPVSLASS